MEGVVQEVGEVVLGHCCEAKAELVPEQKASIS